MKQLSIEEKAKAYDEALKVLHKYDGAHIMFTQDLKEEMFPELKESEDERMIGNIIATIHLYYGEPLEDEAKEMIAWLERRGQTFTKKDVDDAYLKGICDAKHEIEKQGEQNPADKAEQKFEIGDLITNGNLVGKIDKIHKWGYHAFFGGHYADVPDVENWHKWTIQDARDGDVLYNKDEFSGNSVFIYKGISNKTLARLYYARLFKDKDFCIHNDVMWENGVGVNGGEFYPATKEQRATLMKAMADAGYEWDADKKELKKIEQKPTEDINLPEFESYLCLMFQKFRTKGMCTNGEIIDYVKEHSQKLRDILVKPAWSKEDDNIIEWLIGYLEYQIMNATITEEKKNCLNAISILKSLKERYTWKPSDEQMDAINDAIDYLGGNTKIVRKHLMSLYEQLKKLKA